eukprot:45721_1
MDSNERNTEILGTRTDNKLIGCENAFELLHGKCQISDENLRQMISSADSDNDGHLTLLEFSQLLKDLTGRHEIVFDQDSDPGEWVHFIFETGDAYENVPVAGRMKRADLPPLESLISGGIAGALAKTTIAPADRVKILYQVSSERRFSLRAALRSVSKILENEGVLGLWRGNAATMVRVIPHASILFFSFSRYERFYMNYRRSEMTPMSRFCCGALAGVTATSASFPLDLMRARLATQWGSRSSVRYHGYIHCVKTMIREEGLSGFYKGLKPTILGYIPYAGLSFALYESLKHYALELLPKESGEFQTVPRLICGGFAGVIAQSAAYPLDIVRRRMQVDCAPPHGTPRYSNTFGALTHIARSEGIIRGLYKGLSMNWIKGPIAVSVSFTVNDFMKDYFLDRHHESGKWLKDFWSERISWS